MRNLSYENEFWMQFHFHANQSNFHKNGFALRLALKQRHEGTRKWPMNAIVTLNAVFKTFWRKKKCFTVRKIAFTGGSFSRLPAIIYIPVATNSIS